MDEIIVKSQKELDAIPTDYNGRIIIEFGTPYNRAVVNRKFRYLVLMENSSAVLWGNSSAELRENSSAVLRGNSSAVLWENSSAELMENSSAELMENSSAELWGNSSADAKHNSQVNDKTCDHKISISGNARIVYDPANIQEYMAAYELENDGKTVRLFKAVHKRGNRYLADWNGFEYTIGEDAEADDLTEDVNEDCGHGIHMAHKAWCVSYGANWKDLAILELEAEIGGVIVPLGGSGKVRARKVKVIREVPLEECGLYGKILAKRAKA